MKSSRINSFIAVLSFTGVLLSFAPSSFAVERGKKELKTLIATAKTPAQHRRIASYYREQAQRLTEAAKSHDAMAEGNQGRPLSFKPKHPYGVLGISQYHYWAEQDLKEAKKAEGLAVRHEDMAKAAE